jgi:hypothetical protein
MRARPLPLATSKLRVVLVLALGLAGCGPEIGDECETSTDCSQTADRLCDVSQPGGYCTVFNCEPSGANPVAKCPDESACVAFAVEPSPIDGCANALGATPYTKSFCLKKCDNGDDCRSGYACLDVAAEASHGDKLFSAVDLDGPTKVCVVAVSVAPPDSENASNQVCSAPGGSEQGAAGASSEPDGGGGAAGAGP